MKHYWANPARLDQLWQEIGVKRERHDCGKCRDLDREDIIAMQTIDADCNDCKHFKRGKLIKEIPGVTQDMVPLNKDSHFFLGHCMKFDRPTKAFPGNYTGWECFEHRRV